MKKKKTIRLYRAEEKPGSGNKAPDWVKQYPEWQRTNQAVGRWFTDNLEEAEWYLNNMFIDGKIVTVEVPKEVANRYRVSNLEKGGGKDIEENPFAFSRRPEIEYFLPRNIANQKKDYIEKGSSKKEKGLAMRVNVFILFIIGGIALNLNLLNLTGNIISNTIKSPPNLLGILLIIAGMVGIFLSLKSFK